jgi:hypothetical protein
MKIAFLSILLCTLALTAPHAQETDYSRASIEQLIDDLTLISAPAPGIDGGALYSAFIADDTPPEFVVGLLGVPPPTIPPQMRELVRRGVQALPALIRHLSDERPTRLTAGFPGDGNMWLIGGPGFNTEYDARHRTSPRLMPLEDCSKSHCATGVFPDGTYVVRVGDVCYALIGQIVNRFLIAVRYQPSGFIFINSPIEAPILVDRIKEDWGELDAAGHEASLLSDIREGKNQWDWAPALARLRFYYPSAYASLSGADLKKRKAFEYERGGEQGLRYSPGPPSR